MMQEQYRKGLVLGLTMAEVMVLLLFGLLLALVGAVREKDAIEKQYAEEFQKNLEAPPKLEISSGNIPEDEDEDWMVLEECENHNRKLETEMEECTVRAESKEEVEIENVQLQKNMADLLKRLDNLIAQNSESEKEAAALKKELSESEKEVAILSEELEGLKEEQNIPREGLPDDLHGIDRPPCWKKGTRTPYYSFIVTMTARGYRFHRLPTPNEYIGSHAEVLHDAITLDKEEFSQSEMLRVTAEIDTWSRKEECVFYVLLEDQTGPEKNIYLERFEALTSIFYYKPQN